MKLDCELIQDLLPLYEEGLCSAASRRAVEAHLPACEHCRRLTAPLPIETPEELPGADRAVKKSIQKVRRRWLASLLAAVLIVPLLLLSINQFRGAGLCFTNAEDIVTAWRFLHALETEDWETAARMHDFSRDYTSIREALSWEPADWGTTFRPFELAGCEFTGKTHLAHIGILPGTVNDLYGFLYNRQGTAMVPTELWTALMAMDPDAFSREGGQYQLNGERYEEISTPWGEFVVNEGHRCDTAREYADHFDLIPARIYEEARPALEADARQLYDATHADIGWVEGLTEDEFTREMIRRYTTDLHSLENSVSFRCTGYRGTDSRTVTENTEVWDVIFAVTVTHRGQTADAEIRISVLDGRIDVAGISHRQDQHWLDAIDRALYPSAHSGY